MKLFYVDTKLGLFDDAISPMEVVFRVMVIVDHYIQT